MEVRGPDGPPAKGACLSGEWARLRAKRAFIWHSESRQLLRGACLGPGPLALLL